MTKHILLKSIDDLLESARPENIIAMAEGRIISEVQDELETSGSRVTQYRGVNIARSLAQIGNNWIITARSVAEKSE